MKKFLEITMVIFWLVMFFAPMLVTLFLTWSNNSPIVSTLASLGAEFVFFLMVVLIGLVISVRRKKRSQPLNQD